MAHTYMLFDFGTDEEKAQEARHKLDVWKQAFRLDQKLQYKLDRPEEDRDEDVEEDDAEDSSTKGAKPKSNAASAKTAKKDDTEVGKNGDVTLLVRLYFSNHEKLSEQQWLERIPAEQPFKSASPKIIRKGQAGFDDADKQFGDVDKTTGRRS